MNTNLSSLLLSIGWFILSILLIVFTQLSIDQYDFQSARVTLWVLASVCIPILITLSIVFNHRIYSWLGILSCLIGFLGIFWEKDYLLFCWISRMTFVYLITSLYSLFNFYHYFINRKESE